MKVKFRYNFLIKFFNFFIKVLALFKKLVISSFLNQVFFIKFNNKNTRNIFFKLV